MRQGMIALTFDDGYKTDLTVAMQKQLDRGMEPKGTSYIISAYTGESYLDASEKLTLVNNGWDLQCHSHTHTLGGPDGGMTGLTAEELHQEMQNVNAHFQDDLGLPPPEHHAYPGNANNKLIRDILSLYRKSMRVGGSRFCSWSPDLTRLPCFNSEYGTNVNSLEKIKWVIDMCSKHGLYAIINFHELKDEETVRYGQILDYMLEKKIRIASHRELYNELIK